MHTISETDCDSFSNSSRSGEFMERMSPEARREFEVVKVHFDCPANTVLYMEQQAPSNVLFLLAGQVKLSMNSNAGRRLILGIANPGETLGLASALSGNAYDTTAETICPCKMAALARADFLAFLSRNPAAYKDVARELCQDRSRACEQVRTLGLATTAPARLARLLLEWCAGGQKTENGTRLSCPLTHREIGEYIGTSRETVTRIFSEFKYKDMVESRGSTLIISNLKALEIYAGV